MAFIYEINYSQILTLYPVGKKPKSLKNNLQKNSRGEVMESGGTRVEVVGRFNIKDFEDCASTSITVYLFDLGFVTCVQQFGKNFRYLRV